MFLFLKHLANFISAKTKADELLKHLLFYNKKLRSKNAWVYYLFFGKAKKCFAAKWQIKNVVYFLLRKPNTALDYLNS
jgi:hypothetical protein